MKLLWFTDLHLVARGERLHGVDPAARFSASLSSALRLHHDAALVIVTGDIAHRGAEEGYRTFEQTARGCSIPFRLLPGNHDAGGPGQPTAKILPRAHGERLQGWNLLYLDTNLGTAGGCGLDREQVEWLARQVSSGEPCPTMLFLHHPPFPTGIPAIDSEDFENRAAVKRVLEDSRQPLHIFCGHCHRNISGSWGGVPYTALASTHLSFALNLSTTALSPRRSEPEYAVILAEAASVAVHVSDPASPAPGSTDSQ